MSILEQCSPHLQHMHAYSSHFIFKKKNNPFEFRIVWHSCTELKVKKIPHSFTSTLQLTFWCFFFFINLNTVSSSALSWMVLGCFYNVVIHQRKTNYHKIAHAFKEKKNYTESSESIFHVHLKRKNCEYSESIALH